MVCIEEVSQLCTHMFNFFSALLVPIQNGEFENMVKYMVSRPMREKDASVKVKCNVEEHILGLLFMPNCPP